MKKILVLCTGNSCRSQIAHGYLEHIGLDKVKVYSAGVETHGVNPMAIATMKNDGIDISNHTSNNIAEYQHIEFDYVISVCDNAKERCPIFPERIMELFTTCQESKFIIKPVLFFNGSINTNMQICVEINN